MPSAPNKVLKLDNNECLVPFHSQNTSLHEFMQRAQINRYRTPALLEERLAAKHNTDAAHIVVTAGADEALTRFARAFITESSHVIVGVPTFPMIMHHARQATAHVTSLPWLGLEPFPYQQIIEAIQPNTAAVMLATPNNPIGTAIDYASIQRISAALPHGIILLDMVYSDFADVDLTPHIQHLPNVLRVHSLSKSWGLAGLRIGYAAANSPALIKRLRQVGSPFPVSSLSLEYALTHFDELAVFASRYVNEIKRERAELYKTLTLMGIKAWHSQANFVFCQPHATEVFHDQLLTAGIISRLLPDLLPQLGACLRLTCPGNQNDFKTLIPTSAADAAKVAKDKDISIRRGHYI